MPGKTVRALDTEFPNLDPAVVAACPEAPPTELVEVIDGELFLTLRSRPRPTRN